MREKGGCFGRGSGRERRSSKRKEGGVPDDGAGGGRYEGLKRLNVVGFEKSS